MFALHQLLRENMEVTEWEKLCTLVCGSVYKIERKHNTTTMR